MGPIPPRRTTVSPHPTQPHSALLQPDGELGRVGAVRENLVAPAVPCGGENQSVRAGLSPRHATRTKNRRSPTDGQTSIDLTRIGMERTERETAPLLSLAMRCNIPVLADAPRRIDHPGCVYSKKACIFYRTLTLRLSRAWKRERSGRWKASAAADGWARNWLPPLLWIL